MVKIDNVANIFFNTQKKLSPKQARWQELLQEYDFVWKHKPDKDNEVTYALSRRQVQEYVAALTRVESDFVDRIRESAKLDATYQKLVQDVTAGLVRRYGLEDGLLYAKGGKLFVPSGKIRRELLKEAHDPQWVGHPSKDRMYALLSRSYYWPKMELDIELYVRTCLVCQQDKGLTQKEAGLLQPLPIPESPWISISMDFIIGLPKAKGMGSVFVVVDRFSKYAVFMVAPSTCTVEVAANLFYKNVVKYFGLPEDIVSDRDYIYWSILDCSVWFDGFRIEVFYC